MLTRAPRAVFGACESRKRRPDPTFLMSLLQHV
jgi:hypothetical protein